MWPATSNIVDYPNRSYHERLALLDVPRRRPRAERRTKSAVEALRAVVTAVLTHTRRVFA